MPNKRLRPLKLSNFVAHLWTQPTEPTRLFDTDVAWVHLLEELGEGNFAQKHPSIVGTLLLLLLEAGLLWHGQGPLAGGQVAP
jgi:hypothetical protein